MPCKAGFLSEKVFTKTLGLLLLHRHVKYHFDLAKFLLGLRKHSGKGICSLAIRTALHLVTGLLDAFLCAAASTRMLVFTKIRNLETFSFSPPLWLLLPKCIKTPILQRNYPHVPFSVCSHWEQKFMVGHILWELIFSGFDCMEDTSAGIRWSTSYLVVVLIHCGKTYEVNFRGLWLPVIP